MKPSDFNPDFWGCPGCDWPLEDLEEWEYTGGIFWEPLAIPFPAAWTPENGICKQCFKCWYPVR